MMNLGNGLLGMLEHYIYGNGEKLDITMFHFSEFTNDPGITRATREARPPLTHDEPDFILPLLP